MQNIVGYSFIEDEITKSIYSQKIKLIKLF